MTRLCSCFIASVGSIGLLAGCVPFGKAQTASDDHTPMGRIVLIRPKGAKGALRIKHGKGADPAEATEGMLVRRGDLLTLEATARATIICGDGSKQELYPGVQGCPCTSPCTPKVCGLIYDGSPIRMTRGSDTANSTFPIIISPRGTLMLSTRPTIRWSPVTSPAEEITYNVALYGENRRLIWSRDVVSRVELAYPDEEPPLTLGKTYLVVVRTVSGSSEQERIPDTGFTLLQVDQIRALGQAETKIRKLGLPEIQTEFLTANLYASRELFAEAIERLENISRREKEPEIMRMLADLYLRIGLNREAEKRYLEALSLQPESNLRERALTQLGLAYAYENLGILDQARMRLREAIEAYERSGYSAMAESLKKREQRLKR